VTVEDLQRVGKEYFSQMFDPTLTSTAVCCNPSKVTEVRGGLEQWVYYLVASSCSFHGTPAYALTSPSSHTTHPHNTPSQISA